MRSEGHMRAGFKGALNLRGMEFARNAYPIAY